MKKSLVTALGALLLLGGGLSLATSGTAGAKPSGEFVSTTGTDTGNCVSAPCATVNYAISQATAGETINVAAGTYNQTVNIDKPVTLRGAGASKTTIDGTGLDPSAQGYYGVVFVGDAGGAVTVSGFTITNPYPDAYTSGEPEAIALADHNAGDTISLDKNTITEGTADTNSGTDFPIGIDTFLNAATTDISDNTVTGFFQGALLEDNGPATLTKNKFASLISGFDGTNTYPGEGVFFLADEGGTYTNQDATRNQFSLYSGYGIAEDAGYTNGYCNGQLCPGGLTSTLTSNKFALTGGSTAAAIALTATGNGDNLTAQLTTNKGYVTAPSSGISTSSVSGGTLNISENGNKITVKGGAAATHAGSALGALHVPAHHG
ncbi:MAG: DUF1565 domain-containing protein [Acidimicrobiales bacterium]|nr:DUF1565 domain-containing protein [Acidimicrobiales bacterium]